MAELVSVTYLIPAADKEVHDTAHAIISQTMAAGQASNGTGSFWNKCPTTYHLRKGVDHILIVHHHQDLTVLERDEPRLRHLFNAITRLVIAETVRLKNKQAEPEAVEAIEE